MISEKVLVQTGFILLIVSCLCTQFPSNALIDRPMLSISVLGEVLLWSSKSIYKYFRRAIIGRVSWSSASVLEIFSSTERILATRAILSIDEPLMFALLCSYCMDWNTETAFLRTTRRPLVKVGERKRARYSLSLVFSTRYVDFLNYAEQHLFAYAHVPSTVQQSEYADGLVDTPPDCTVYYLQFIFLPSWLHALRSEWCQQLTESYQRELGAIGE